MTLYSRFISAYLPLRKPAMRDAIFSAFGSNLGQLANGKTKIASLRPDRFCCVREGLIRRDKQIELALGRIEQFTV